MNINYYLVHLKRGKVVKISCWKEKERRDDAFNHYKDSPYFGKHFEQMQIFEDNPKEYW